MNQPPERQAEPPHSIAEDLSQFLGRQGKTSDNLSDAFQHTIAKSPDVHGIHKLQVQTKLELQEIDLLVRKLHRKLFISNCLLSLLIICSISGIASVWMRSVPESDNAIALTSADDSVEGGEAQSARLDLMTDLPLAMDAEPLSPGDLAMYPLVFDLYRRAVRFRRSTFGGSVSERSARDENYIGFLTDVTKVAERAAEENVSDDLLVAIVKITQLAKQLREGIGETSTETDLLDEEIRSILRRYVPSDDAFNRTRM